jgi:hypothetical protein
MALTIALFVGGVAVVGGRSMSRYVDLGKIALRVTSALGESEEAGGEVTSEAVHYGELRDALDNIRARPIFGWGLGHLLERRATAMLLGPHRVAGRLMRVHDVYLDIGVKMGLVGLAVFMWWLVVSGLQLYRATRRYYREQRALCWLFGGLAATWAGWIFANMGTTMIFGGNRIGIMFFGVVALLSCWEYYEGSTGPEVRGQEVEDESGR